MSTAAIDLFPDHPQIKRRDWSIISVVGIAHAMSHFFQLIFPTLYISLASEYGYDYVQLGALVSIFFLTSCVGQASSGFVVDRIGPAPVLHFGLACFVLSAILIGSSNGYVMLVIAAIVGGAGNSVFHPVDYSIINQRVSPSRLGHAFSAHGLTGNLGWALTPVFMSTIIYLADWRIAAFSAAALIGVVLWLTWISRHMLAGKQALPTPSVAVRPPNQASMPDSDGASSPESTGTPTHSSGASAQMNQAPANRASGAGSSVLETLSDLISRPSLWGAFLFFAFTSIAFSAVQNYTIPLMGDVYGIDKVLAGTALSGYMLAAATGMLLGGFLVGANPRTELTVAASLVAAGLTLVLLATGWLPPYGAIALVGLAGFCSGISTPSRDMLIRRVTPKKAVGAVYGLVYSGMDVGASLGPVLFGLMLDRGFKQGPWFGAATAFAISAILAVAVARAAGLRKEANT